MTHDGYDSSATAGDNAHMADSAVLIAVVTGGFTILGATLPQITSVVQSGRSDKRKESERRATRRNEACVALREAIGDLRTQVADNADYHGSEMGARLALVRKYAKEAEVHALKIGFIAPEPLSRAAMRLAAAGAALVVKTEENTNVDAGVVTDRPDFTEVDTRITEFTKVAMKYNVD
jgi:hypothetical protein